MVIQSLTRSQRRIGAAAANISPAAPMATSPLTSERPSLHQLRAGEGVYCKKNCGFYGLPEWHGLCSKCWRSHKAEYDPPPLKGFDKQPDHHHRRHLFHPSSSVVGGNNNNNREASSMSVDFSRFEEKRQAQKQTAQHIWSSFSRKHDSVDPGSSRPTTLTPSPSSSSTRFSKSPSVSSNIGSSTAHAPTTPSALKDAEVHKDVDEFNKFLKQLPKPAAVAMANRVPKLVERVVQKSNGGDASSIDETSKMVTDFLEQLSEQLTKNANNNLSAFKELSDEERSKLLRSCEIVIQLLTYDNVFCPTASDDEDRDIALQTKIRKLTWLSPHNLGAVIDERNVEVRQQTEDAITTIFQVDMHKSCPAKLDCITRFCQHIVRILELSQDELPNADSLLPAIILLVVRANPVRLHSNVKYIMRYANPHSLRSGEAGYFFTNLCCAISFIEQLDAKSLDMSEEEFQHYMRDGDVSGEDAVGGGGGGGGRASLSSKESFIMHSIGQIKRDTENIIAQTEVAERMKQELAQLTLETRRLFEQYEATVARSEKAQRLFEAHIEAIRRRTKPSARGRVAEAEPLAVQSVDATTSADITLPDQTFSTASAAVTEDPANKNVTPASDETLNLYHLRECRSTPGSGELEASVDNQSVMPDKLDMSATATTEKADRSEDDAVKMQEN